MECRLSPRGGHRLQPPRQPAGGPKRSGTPPSDRGSDVDARRQTPSSPRQPRRVPGGDCLRGAVDGGTAGRELRQTLGCRLGVQDGGCHHLQDWPACGALSQRRRPPGVPSATRRQPCRHPGCRQRGHGVQAACERRLSHLGLPGRRPGRGAPGRAGRPDRRALRRRSVLRGARHRAPEWTDAERDRPRRRPAGRGDQRVDGTAVLARRQSDRATVRFR